MIQKLQF